MKRILLAATLALSLAGCSTLQNIGTALSLGTTSIVDPVTPTKLYQMENAITLVFAGLNTWKQTCVQGLIPPACKGQISAVQIYTRQIPPYLTQLRAFVKSGDQVNAVSVFNNLSTLIGTIKSSAAASGATVGG
jgi:Prokaryotic membrane lipoprotein lipid attachment site